MISQRVRDCRPHGAAVEYSVPRRQRCYIVDLFFPHAHEKARSTSRIHLALSTLSAIMRCFVSSVRQGSRGLLHHHCLPGQPRILVAVQPSSGLRGMP